MSGEKRKEIVVMELPLPEGERLLFFVEKDIYDHQDLTVKGNSGQFYYYNSGTCPINWLRGVKRVVHVTNNGEVDADPHGVFRFAYSFHDKSFVEDCMEMDEQASDIARQYLTDEKAVKDFLALFSQEGMSDEILRQWRFMAFSREALLLLAKICFEEDEVFLLEEIPNGFSLYHNLETFEFTNPNPDLLTRVKFLLEFEILNACRY